MGSRRYCVSFYNPIAQLQEMVGFSSMMDVNAFTGVLARLNILSFFISEC